MDNVHAASISSAPSGGHNAAKLHLQMVRWSPSLPTPSRAGGGGEKWCEASRERSPSPFAGGGGMLGSWQTRRPDAYDLRQRRSRPYCGGSSDEGSSIVTASAVRRRSAPTSLISSASNAGSLSRLTAVGMRVEPLATSVEPDGLGNAAFASCGSGTTRSSRIPKAFSRPLPPSYAGFSSPLRPRPPARGIQERHGAGVHLSGGRCYAAWRLSFGEG